MTDAQMRVWESGWNLAKVQIPLYCMRTRCVQNPYLLKILHTDKPITHLWSEVPQSTSNCLANHHTALLVRSICTQAEHKSCSFQIV